MASGRTLEEGRGKTRQHTRRHSGPRSSNPPNDPEKSAQVKVSHIPQGYSQAAAFIDLHEDFSVFRKFGSLQVRMLLYRQTELDALERRLRIIDDDEREEHRDSHMFSNQSWLLDKKDPNSERPAIVEKIRETLALYNKELFQYQKTLRLQPAAKWQIENINNWTEKHQPFVRKEARVYEEGTDLITLREHDEDEDGFPGTLKRKLGEHLGVFYKIFETKSNPLAEDDEDIIFYSGAGKILVLRIIFAFFVTAIVCAGVITLYFVDTSYGRLITLCAATLICSSALAVFTTASKSEILAATAAYCAVMVVFVGSSDLGISHPLTMASNVTTSMI